VKSGETQIYLFSFIIATFFCLSVIFLRDSNLNPILCPSSVAGEK